MKRAIGKPGSRIDHVADAVVIVVALSVVMMFGLLYALTPPPMVATVEHQYSMQQ
jgi:hypothetical protein